MAFFYLYVHTDLHWKAGFRLKGEENKEEKSSACSGLTPTLNEDMNMPTGRAWGVLLSPKVQILPNQETSQKAERKGHIQRMAESLGPTLCMLTAQWGGDYSWSQHPRLIPLYGSWYHHKWESGRGCLQWQAQEEAQTHPFTQVKDKAISRMEHLRDEYFRKVTNADIRHHRVFNSGYLHCSECHSLAFCQHHGVAEI